MNAGFANHVTGKPEPGESPGKGKKHGHKKVGVCHLEGDAYVYKQLPSPAANRLVGKGKAIFAATPEECEAATDAIVPDEPEDA